MIIEIFERILNEGNFQVGQLSPKYVSALARVGADLSAHVAINKC